MKTVVQHNHRLIYLVLLEYDDIKEETKLKFYRGNVTDETKSVFSGPKVKPIKGTLQRSSIT